MFELKLNYENNETPPDAAHCNPFVELYYKYYEFEALLKVDKWSLLIF
jgi:hypothetical protein